MVKSFHFPLQKVLDVRQIVEDRQAVALKNSQSSLNTEKKRLDNLAQRKHAQLKIDENICTDQVNLSLNGLKISVDYISQLNDKIISQFQVVEKSNEKMEEKRDVLIKVSKEKKIVEILREHQLIDYKIKNRKKESKDESEIALRVVLKNKIRGNNQ